MEQTGSFETILWLQAFLSFESVSLKIDDSLHHKGRKKEEDSKSLSFVSVSWRERVTERVFAGHTQPPSFEIHAPLQKSAAVA
jgi:hypothetical protein